MIRLVLLPLLFIPLCSKAQVLGIVQDGETRAPIPFAYLFYPELNQGQQADENGMFVYGEMHGTRRLRVQVSAIGYESYVGFIDAGATDVAIFLYPGHLTLREVVISAPASALDGSRVMSVTRIARSEMDVLVPVSLTEGLKMIPGLDVITTGVGIGKPVIRGMSGNRIATYLHGVRIENQQWGPDHGLGLGTLGVEAVEVIKGPASLLYGPDAIGGVLYLVDERFADSGTYSAFGEAGFVHNSLGLRNQAGLKVSGERLSLNLAGSYDNYADYAIPGGDRVLNTRFSGPSFTSSLGYRGNKYVTKLRYSFVDSRAGLPGVAHHEVEEGDHEEEHEEEWFSDSVGRDRLLPDQRNVQHHLSSENTWFLESAKLDIIAGWSANRRGEFEDNAETASLNLRLDTYTTDVRWSTELSDKTSFIAGARWMYQVNENSGEEKLIPDAIQSNAGMYGLMQQRIRKSLLQAGIRFDHNVFMSADSLLLSSENSGDFRRQFNIISYSAGLSTPFGKSTELKFNLTGGYRAPNGYELASDGVHHGAIRYERGNANLKAENAIQTDVAYLFSNDHLELSLEPFASIISNYIFLEPTNEVIDGFSVFQYVNANVIMAGGEARIHWHPHFLHMLHIETTSSFVRAREENGDDLPFIPAFRQSSIIRVELGERNTTFRYVFIGHTWRSKQDFTAALEMSTPQYHLLDAGAAILVGPETLNATLTWGVRNVLDRRYADHLSRLRPLDIPNEGRRFFISLRVDVHGDLKRERTGE